MKNAKKIEIIQASLLATILGLEERVKELTKKEDWSELAYVANNLKETIEVMENLQFVKFPTPTLTYKSFKFGDVVEFVGLPESINEDKNPLIGKRGVVINSQPNDIDVMVEGYGSVGFNPANLVKV